MFIESKLRACIEEAEAKIEAENAKKKGRKKRLSVRSFRNVLGSIDLVNSVRRGDLTHDYQHYHLAFHYIASRMSDKDGNEFLAKAWAAIEEDSIMYQRLLPLVKARNAAAHKGNLPAE